MAVILDLTTDGYKENVRLSYLGHYESDIPTLKGKRGWCHEIFSHHGRNEVVDRKILSSQSFVNTWTAVSLYTLAREGECVRVCQSYDG